MRAERPDAAPGYTLLEMMIVVTIIGIMAALAAPPFLQMINQSRRLTALADIQGQLSALPMQARSRGRDLVLQAQPSKVDPSAEPATMSPLAVAEPAKALILPDGWTAQPVANIWIRYDGVCFGGQVEARFAGRLEATYDLAPPYCTPQPRPARAS